MKRTDKQGNPIKVKRRSVGVKHMKTGDRRTIFNHFKRLRGFEAKRDRMVFQTGILTGLRVEEMFHLDVGDLYPEPKPGEPRQVAKFIPVVGKGNVYREVPVSEEFADEVRAYLKAKKAAGESIEPLAPFFCASGGGRLAYRTLQHIVTKHCERAGLVEVDAETHKTKARFSIHNLRDTFAVRWLSSHLADLSAGEAYARLMLIMGHEDIQTTQKYTRYDVHDSDEEV